MPLIGMHRLRGRTDGADVSYLDCATCPDHFSYQVRRAWHCGLLPREQWVDAPGTYPTGHEPPHVTEDRTCDTCPGSLIRQPEVLEASMARDWAETGQLQQRYEAEGLTVTPMLMDCIQILRNSIADAEAFHTQLRSERG